MKISLFLDRYANRIINPSPRVHAILTYIIAAKSGNFITKLGLATMNMVLLYGNNLLKELIFSAIC